MEENLYCPRCGKQFSSGTAYCRTCGLSLDGVSEIVTGEAATAPEIRSGPNYNFIRIGIALFIFGTVLGLANIIVRDLGLFPEIYGKIVFLTFVCIGMTTMGASFVFPSKRYLKQKPRGPADPAIDHGHRTSVLPHRLPTTIENYIEPTMSNDDRQPIAAEPGTITEHTTRHLT